MSFMPPSAEVTLALSLRRGQSVRLLVQTLAYQREVVKRALDLHAGAAVLAHDHSSGAAEPSRADEVLTRTPKSALALVEVRVLGHLIVGRHQVVSLAERGLL
jgi:DNA repair protein RadC